MPVSTQITSPAANDWLVVGVGNTTSPVAEYGPSATRAGMICQMGSTVFAVAPSSKIRRRNVPDSSAPLTPGATSGSTASMASSLIDCARRMHSSSSAVFTTLQVLRSAVASATSRPCRAACSGIVYSSTAIGPSGSASRNASAPSGHSTGSAPCTWSAGRSGGTPSGNAV